MLSSKFSTVKMKKRNRNDRKNKITKNINLKLLSFCKKWLQGIGSLRNYPAKKLVSKIFQGYWQKCLRSLTGPSEIRLARKFLKFLCQKTCLLVLYIMSKEISLKMELFSFIFCYIRILTVRRLSLTEFQSQLPSFYPK